ncbi:hypothetical protein WIS52_01965 [Pseudonocardia nematodicida]|uniref:Uncharacterized protein n=1 Tax=Pseudonocardia nematodicida TaxID=1206997 RepID=A0ABV1K5X3_9PSEU
MLARGTRLRLNIADTDKVPWQGDLVPSIRSSLVGSLPNLRAGGTGRPDQPVRTADLALHGLGRRGDWVAMRTAGPAAQEPN